MKGVRSVKLEQLEQVAQIAKTGSISKAAASLFLSQPSLSASVRQLENEMGADIFIRTKRGVELTPFGMTFVKYAEKILDQMGALEKLAKDNVPAISQTLSVANSHFRFASAAVAMLMKRHREDGSRFIIREGFRNDCINWTSEGVCDLGVVSYNLNEEKEFRQLLKLKHLHSRLIAKPTARVVIGAGHPLYHTDVTEVTYRDMAPYPFVTYDDAEAGNYLRSAYIHATAANLRVITTDRASLHEILEFTDGYALGFSTDVVYGNIAPASRTRLITLKDSKISFGIACISSTGFEDTPLAREFAELITGLCNDPDFWEKHPELKEKQTGAENTDPIITD